MTPNAESVRPDEAWWIATEFRTNGGQPLWGPFATRDLALTMREFIEKANKPTTYCVDTWPTPNDGSVPT